MSGAIFLISLIWIVCSAQSSRGLSHAVPTLPDATAPLPEALPPATAANLLAMFIKGNAYNQIIRPNSAKGVRPGVQATTTEATPTQMSQLLQLHNVHREDHLAGALIWNSRAASMAASYAATCTWAHSQDSDRMSPQGFVQGENLAFTTTGDAPTALRTAVEEWYAENTKYQYGGAKPDTGVGHFTQLVWRAAKRVGCGYATCTVSGAQGILTVCRYEADFMPGGNIDGLYNKNVLPIGATLPPVPPATANTLTSLQPLISGRGDKSCKKFDLAAAGAPNNYISLCLRQDAKAQLFLQQPSQDPVLYWNSTNKPVTTGGKRYKFLLTNTGDMQVRDASKPSSVKPLWSSRTGGVGLAPHTLEVTLKSLTIKGVKAFMFASLRDYNGAYIWTIILPVKAG